MKDIDSDDELQVLKRWWEENGTSIVFTVSVVIAGLVGWNWWKADQQKQVAQSFVAYDKLVVESSAAESSGDDLRIAQADFLAGEIKQDYPDSYYASFAAFLKAKQAVVDGDMDAAIEELQWVVDKNPSEEFLLTAKFRLAKVYFSQGNYDLALEQLDVGDAGEFVMIYGELRGDIYLSQQKYADAVEAYEAALGAAEGSEVNVSPLLAEKISYSSSFL